MNFYQKSLAWFRNQSRLVQSGLIIGACVLFVVGLWLSSNSDTGSNSTQMVDSTAWMVSVFFKLLLVILLIIGVAVVAKRYMTGRPMGKERQMQVVETLALNPKRALHIVKVGGQTLLIGATDQSVSLISELDPTENGSFDAAFQQIVRDQEQN